MIRETSQCTATHTCKDELCTRGWACSLSLPLCEESISNTWNTQPLWRTWMVSKSSTTTVWWWQEVPTCGPGWMCPTFIACWQIKTLPLLETIDTGVSWWIRVVNEPDSLDHPSTPALQSGRHCNAQLRILQIPAIMSFVQGDELVPCPRHCARNQFLPLEMLKLFEGHEW